MAAADLTDGFDRDDVQGLVARGYGSLRAAAYLLLGIQDAGTAAAWVGRNAGQVASVSAPLGPTAVQLAFTASGLRKLGLGTSVLATFSDEFLAGMVTPHRSRILGDIGASAPEQWAWGGPTTSAADILLLAFAQDDSVLRTLLSTLQSGLVDAGLSPITALGTTDLGDREPFGFADGMSQPLISGLGTSGPPANTVRTGEFVLGYPNEYGLLTDRPLIDPALDSSGHLPRDPGGSGRADLGRNGTYVVFRQLRQDVAGFWQFVDGTSKNPDGSSNPAARTKLAAKIVGRWPGGAPLATSPTEDDPRRASETDFGYFVADRAGFNCPIGAHVRRTNPRDALDPDLGPEQSVAIGKRHRILRRGREFGPPSKQSPDRPDMGTDGAERGLHFICLNANIARQFEFIQHTWVNSPKFGGLYDDSDPLIGSHMPSGATFTMQGKPFRQRLTGLPRFVTVGGGGYFFLPGIRALRFLGSLARQPAVANRAG
jgi:Dyp-type peroxidase family